jgi:flagellar motor switch protein FliM
MSKQLPPQPHLDSLKKQARQLLKGYKSDQPDAVERIRTVLAQLPPSATQSLTLRHAQQVVAHEYGFSSWQKLAAEVGQPTPAQEPQNWYIAHYDRMARGLIAALRTGREEAFGRHNNPMWQQLQQRWPRFAATSRAEILSTELSLEEAREVVARENDFQSWTQLEATVSAHTSGPLVNKEQLRGLERLHDEFARRLAINFTSAADVDRQVDVNTAFVDLTSYGEFILSISSPNRSPKGSFRLQVDGLDGDVVLDIAMPVVQGLMAAGGDRDNERTRLEYFAERIARDLEKVWAPIHQIAVRSFELYTDPAALEIAPAHGIVTLLAFEAKARPAETGWSGLVSLCYPSSIVELQPQLAEHGPKELIAGA